MDTPNLDETANATDGVAVMDSGVGIHRVVISPGSGIEFSLRLNDGSGNQSYLTNRSVSILLEIVNTVLPSSHLIRYSKSCIRVSVDEDYRSLGDLNSSLRSRNGTSQLTLPPAFCFPP